MNSLKRLDKLLVRGAISKEEYLEQIGAYETSKGVTMQTAEGIISFLESELNEAMELHNNAKENKDMERSLTLLIKAHTIGELLEKIKKILKSTPEIKFSGALLCLLYFNGTTPSEQITSVAGTCSFQYAPNEMAFHSSIVPSNLIVVSEVH